MEETRVFLNTWGAYNNGCIGYGWMTASEAIDFFNEKPNRDGGEWFIADIDNYLGVDFGSLEYCDVMEVCETIQTLEDMDDWMKDEIIGLMEMRNCTVEEAIEKHDRYIFYPDVETYLDSMDELIEMQIQGSDSIIARYFDYDAYHRDCMFDVTECSNGVVIAE